MKNKLSCSLLYYKSEYKVLIFVIVFPGGSVLKNLPANAGDAGSVPGIGRSPGEGNGNSLQYSCLANPMDGGTWLGYSPWGREESDTTERLHSLHSRCFIHSASVFSDFCVHAV